ncbi:hypothetical protein GCM10011521_21260 [Arenimonas soli]|uniref:Uncharacterized protein n=1 Tax=Arenimonas soli TaxID=2269504 RepID=A0ABQ1HLV9_9GAMM|nr:hypothetical protein GCM10011521_21260 [Arenimonas soli]
MLRILQVIVALGLVACSQPTIRPASKALSAQELVDCKAMGGRVEQALYTTQTCVWPTSDGGEMCRDSSDCEGWCEAPWGSEPDSVVDGACSAEGSWQTIGCFNHVSDGKATGEWCFH